MYPETHYIYAGSTLPWLCGWEALDQYKGFSSEEHAFHDSKQHFSHWQGQTGSPFYWALTSQSPLSSASLYLPLGAPSQGCLIC